MHAPQVSLTTVNGFDLPTLILELIQAGRWKMPTDPGLLRIMFDSFNEPCELSGPRLYLPPQMQSETDGLTLFRHLLGSLYLGTPDPSNYPGDIDLTTTVLIGDTGIGCDAPIALDYRESRLDPGVIWCHWSKDYNQKPYRWIKISRNIASFVETLQL